MKLNPPNLLRRSVLLVVLSGDVLGRSLTFLSRASLEQTEQTPVVVAEGAWAFVESGVCPG